MLRRCVNLLATQPPLLHAARWILEGGFHGHHSVFKNELHHCPEPVLDVGCGSGTHAVHWQPDCYCGIDVDLKSLAAARRKFPQHHFAQADASHLPFPAQSFGTVMICGVLHHLPDHTVLQVLQECRRVVQPQGRWVIWEDIPIQHPLNLPGAIVHCLDQGQFIRPINRLLQLLQTATNDISYRCLRSGCMDYAVFRLQLAPDLLRTADNH
jgi:SAM-dependent methyltransferase